MAKYLYDDPEQTMEFGKHKGEEIGDLIKYETAYIDWLLDEDIIELDGGAAELHEKVKRRRL